MLDKKLEASIAELRVKIDRERKVKEGAQHLLQALTDAETIQNCQANLQESDKRLDFFISEMLKLQKLRLEVNGQPIDLDISSAVAEKSATNIYSSTEGFQGEGGLGIVSQAAQSTTYPLQHRSTSNPNLQGSGRNSPRLSGRNSQIGKLFKAFSFSSARRDSENSLKSNGSSSSLTDIGPEMPATDAFGYIRSDSTITRDKVQFLVSETQRKLEIEEEVKEGAQKMMEATSNMSQLPESKNLKVDLTTKITECSDKIFIFQKALNHFHSLELVKTDFFASDVFQSNRKECSGRLLFNMLSLSAIPGKKTSKSELFITFRVDNTPKSTTRRSKSSWGEDIVIYVEKAKEIEITVHEVDGGILAILWFQLSDFVAHADALRQSIKLPALPAGDPRIVDAWFDLIPGGKVKLLVELSAAQEKTKKKPDQALSRQKAVQKFFVKQGHKFSPIYSYKIMRCAVCKEILVRGQGLNCQMCDFTCHKKCLEDVVPKCISLTSNEMTENDFLVNHSIPHRFAKATAVGVHWCGHCGRMVSISKLSHFKCTECSLIAHDGCHSKIPNLCGLPDGFLESMRSFSSQKLAKSQDNIALSIATTSFAPNLPSSQESSAHLSAEPTRSAHNNEVDSQRFEFQKDPPSQNKMDLLKHNNNMGDRKTSSTALNERKASTGFLNSVFGGDRDRKGSTTSLNKVVSAADLMEDPQAAPKIMQQNKQHKASLFSGATSNGSLAVTQGTQAVQNAAKKARDESLTFFKQGTKGVGLDDFTFLAVLGKGNFGKVMLAQEKFTNAFYGIKVLKKEFILEHDEVESTKSEKRVFQIASADSHPFLVNLHSCFQTESRLYFVMEYISGGDLMWHIQHKKFSFAQAHYYSCEVLLALEYLHTNQILYRDLKLDNILLTIGGHVKLADYGLCKERMGYGKRTNTFCGTPEFMAPEILSEKPYGREVDWWSFGVLLYEMLLGKAPFAGDNEQKIFAAVLKSNPHFPSTLQPDALDIMSKLLIKNPDKRLGSTAEDGKEIKKHNFFAKVNWDDVYHLRIPPPYLPNLTGPTDLSNFDEEFTNEMPVLTPVHSVLSAAHQEDFRGFTYISEWAKKTRAALL